MKVASLLLLALSTSAGAHSLASTDPQFLYSETSQAGETLDAFVKRIAPRARQVTAELRSEVCGSFQENAGLYRIDIKTNRSPWGCNIDFRNDGEWKSNRLTLHTHTKQGGNGFSATDNKLGLRGYVVSPAVIYKRIGNGAEVSN